jgi:hypothetical protein
MTTMTYQVLTTGKRTQITDLDSNIRIAVFEQDGKNSPAGTAYCLATQYKILGGFIPQRVLVFRLQ